MKNPLTPTGIEPVTFRFVAQHLNHCATVVIMQIWWPIAIQPAVEHGSGQKTLFRPVRPGHCQQLHPLIFMWWEGNLTQRFSTRPIREMLAQSGHEPRPSMSVGRPASASNNTGRLDTHHNKHWPGRSNTKRRCCVCSVGGVKQMVIFRCVKCDVALCVDRNSFEDYHTKTNL